MQETSSIYKTLWSKYISGDADVRFQTILAAGAPGVLVDEKGAAITFGGYRILVSGDEDTSGYGEELLISMKTTQQLFSDQSKCVGNCVSARIEVVMLKPDEDLPRQAKLRPYVRLTDGTTHSEWVKKGVFYIDTRKEKTDNTGTGRKWLTIQGYDAMLRAEQDYPSSTLQWPATDIAVVREICTYLGMELDPRTVSILTKGYAVQYPAQYSCREVLGYIAAMYGGNFIMSDSGQLLLVQIGMQPASTAELARRIRSLTSTDALPAYDRIELIVNEDSAYYAGSEGRTLTLECPWGTQAMADALLTQFKSFRYKPFKAEGAILDPSAEIGDRVTVSSAPQGEYDPDTGEHPLLPVAYLDSVAYAMDTVFGGIMATTITAPFEEELDHEYPYVPKQNRKVRRQLRSLTTELTVQAGMIQGEITDRINENDILQSSITQQASQISAKVSKSGGSSSSFGWDLTDSAWTLTSNGSTVLKASASGLEVSGKITAKSGSIGGFTIESNCLSTDGQTWGGSVDGGVYIGPSGIQFGENFKVSRWGSLEAYDGFFTGTVYANGIAYEGDAGYFSGYGLEKFSVGGWWGNDRIDTYTLTTTNFVDSVNESLANADWAAGVLSGAESWAWIGAYEVSADYLYVSDYMSFGGHQLYLGSFPDGNGTIQRCVQWYD